MVLLVSPVKDTISQLIFPVSCPCFMLKVFDNKVVFLRGRTCLCCKLFHSNIHQGYDLRPAVTLDPQDISDLK